MAKRKPVISPPLDDCWGLAFYFVQAAQEERLSSEVMTLSETEEERGPGADA
jgi:hypothetical protein